MNVGRRGSLTLSAGLIAIVLLAVGGTAWWTRPPGTALTSGQLLTLLPARTTLHSFVQVNLDGRTPLEAAAVVLIPAFPGAVTSQYAEIVAQYDRWRRRYVIVYQRPLSGVIPVSVDAGRIVGERDGVLFQGLTDDGRWSFDVLGQAHRRLAVLLEGDSRGRVAVGDPLVIDPAERRAYQWDGSSFAPRPLAGATSPPAVSVTWRYGFRNGVVLARTNQVLLMPRQILRLQRIGGTTPIIVPDGRLDVVENGFRARRPGTYAIRLLIPFSVDAEAYVLTVLVSDATP